MAPSERGIRPDVGSDRVNVFPSGSTVVRRDVFESSVWTAAPYRVISDDGDTLVIACWPGVELMAPTTWVEWVRSGDPGVRAQGIPNLAAGRWGLDHFTWQETTLLARYTDGQYFCVTRFFDRHDRCADWYVDFIQPPRRTAFGIDTFDLFLDLIVTGDLSRHHWKDEDEYAQGRRLGLIDDATHANVETARQQVLALVDARHGPFAEDWSSWRRDPGCPLPVLPWGRHP